ncbi:MAG: sigma factor [Candidatus Sulfotelmatobacter sp.]
METTNSRDANDPLTWYLRELVAIKPLTEKEETELLQHVRSEDKQAEFASRRLIESKLALVVQIAERHSSVGIDMLDLIEKGNQGLLSALRNFRENSGKSFTTYATGQIEAAISKAVSISSPRSE